jgi:uncharacterized protein YqkB
MDSDLMQDSEGSITLYEIICREKPQCTSLDANVGAIFYTNEG